MRAPLLPTALMLGYLAGCGGQSNIKPADVLDERTGMTVGALEEPIEYVERSQNAALANTKRASFAYLGPVEWDRMGEITYSIWIHVAPGNDRQVGDIRAPGAVTLNLDDGPMPLTLSNMPADATHPYKPVVSWGQTANFEMSVETLKRMASSQKLELEFHSSNDSTVTFIPSHETRGTLKEFERTRGITDD